MKVKVFNFSPCEFDDMEKRINQWLKTHCQVTIDFITQSESLTEHDDGGSTVLVWYQDNGS